MLAAPMSDPAEEAAERPVTAGAMLSDEELLSIVKAERRAAIGLDNDSELIEDREKALEYFKGQMDDVASLKGRSSAVSSDVADAVETVLPDLLEIFIGGEDVAAFQPHGPEDEKAAEQQTDYVNHVVLQQNPGFLNYYTVFKDALLSKVGVWKYWAEDCDQDEELTLKGKTRMELLLAEQDGWQVVDLKPSQTQPYAPPQAQLPAPMAAPMMGAGMPGMAPDLMGSTALTPPPEPLFDAVMVKPRRDTMVKIAAVPPEHFAVAKDTVAGKLDEATYCCMRSHPRAQELLTDGYDEADVADLPAWNGGLAESTEQARDTAGEDEMMGAESTSELRQVEIVEHYVRIRDEGSNKLQLWRVVTGKNESILLEREKASRIPFAAVTPYIQTHRFYGRSLADLLLEIQRIRTVLLRMLLDSGYFALNQRMEIALDQASDTTIEDYLDNRPNRPVLSKSGNALRPISSAGLGFDAMQALEFISTQSEQRTGVVRNAQGLNPDTLHDTAKGAMALIGAAQKRVRMMARVFAEIGVKPLLLGVHALLRENPSQPAVVRLRGSWVNVDPTDWGNREDMDIQVGVGSGGREQDLAHSREIMAAMAQIVAAQGGPKGPIVTLQNIYYAADTLFNRLGRKDTDRLLTDPAPALKAMALNPQPPAPNPDVVKAQMENQLHQQKAVAEHQLNQAKAAADAATAQAKVAADAELARYKADQQVQLQREQMAAETQLKQQQMAYDAQAQLRSPPIHYGGHVG